MSFFSGAKDGYVALLFNLSLYQDVNVSGEYVVIDENRLFPGIDLSCAKRSTHMKVTSNVVLSDNFTQGGSVICKAINMLREKKNVPLSPKAEAFLIENDLPVYSMPGVKTCTVPIGKGDFVIDVDSKNKEGIEQFDIVGKNDPYNLRAGKFMENKFYKGGEFLVDIVSSRCYFDDGCKSFDVPRYNDPAELRNWHRFADFFVGDSHHPWYVRYLWDGEKRVNLVFMSTVTKNSKIWYVFRDRSKIVSVLNEVV